jgi:hypothetical protein
MVRAVAVAGSAGGVAVSLVGLAAVPGWLLVTVVVVAVVVVVPVAVLVGLLLFVPAEQPVSRLERIVAALRRTPPPGPPATPG